MGRTVSFVDPSSGIAYAIDADDPAAVRQALENQWVPETPEGAVDRTVAARVAEDYSSPADQGWATAAGAAPASSLGGADVLDRTLVGRDDAFRSRMLREANPGLSTLGEVGGGVLGAFASGGTSLLAKTPAALTTRLGMALGRAAPETGILARTGRAALGGAVDAGLQNVGTGISDLAMSDDDLSIERVAGTLSSRFATGAAFGGAAGGALGLLEHGLTAGARRLKAAREGQPLADALTGSAAIPEDIALLDRAGVKDARAAELARIEATRVPERASLVDELQKFRETTKTTRPWDAVAVGGTRDSLAAVEAEATSLAKAAARAEAKAAKAEARLVGGGKRPKAGADSLTTQVKAAREAAADARQLADEAAAQLEVARTASEAVAPRWMREAGKTYIEADKHIDRLLRNREGLAELGGESMRKSFRAALQEQRQALEEIQNGAAELNIIHATDRGSRRVDALAAVPDTIAANRALQDRIEQLAQPMASPRLSALDSHDLMLTQPKPEPGLGQKIKAAGAFSAVSAVGHGILPAAIGFAVAPVGALAAAHVLGRKVGPTMVAAHRAALERTERAVGAFLTGTRAARRVAPKVAALGSTAILEGVRFGPEQPDPAPSNGARRPKLEIAYEARARELAAAIMPTPEGPKVRPGVRVAMGRQLAALHAVAPHVADKAETLQAKKLLYAYNKMPRPMQLGMTTIAPDEMAIRSWARTVAAMEDPGGIEDRLAAGTLTPEDGEVMRDLYPARLAEVFRQIMAKLGDRRMPYEQRINLSILTGEAVDGSMAPHIIEAIQRDYAEEPGTEGGTQAPQPVPAFGSVKKPEPTRAQQNAG